jgi:hypothetical protein
MTNERAVPGEAAREDPRGGAGAGFRPPVLVLLALVVVAIWLLFLEPIGRPRADSPIPGGGADRQLVVALDPDSVRVGEPFILGVTMRTDAPGEVRFPPTLTLTDELEQTGGAEVRASEDQLEWRAYYPLVAWRAEQIQVPEFSVGTLVAGADAPSEVLVRPPAVEVLSVLPDSTEEELELREARPLLRIRGPTWLWLLLGLLALAPLWWWWSRRLSPAGIGPPLGPAERALQALAELRGRSKRGELSGAELFDGIESALRGYVAATRAWRPSQTLGALGRGDAGLATALARSALARFARLRTTLDSSLAAIDAAIGFVRRDSEPEPATESATPEVDDQPRDDGAGSGPRDDAVGDGIAGADEA